MALHVVYDFARSGTKLHSQTNISRYTWSRKIGRSIQSNHWVCGSVCAVFVYTLPRPIESSVCVSILGFEPRVNLLKSCQTLLLCICLSFSNVLGWLQFLLLLLRPLSILDNFSVIPQLSSPESSYCVFSCPINTANERALSIVILANCVTRHALSLSISLSLCQEPLKIFVDTHRTTRFKYHRDNRGEILLSSVPYILYKLNGKLFLLPVKWYSVFCVTDFATFSMSALVELRALLLVRLKRHCALNKPYRFAHPMSKLYFKWHTERPIDKTTTTQINKLTDRNFSRELAVTNRKYTRTDSRQSMISLEIVSKNNGNQCEVGSC